MSKQIKLTQGKYAIVDDEDFGKVSKYKWCFVPSGHACRRSSEDKLVTLEEELYGIYHNSKTRLIFRNHNSLDLRKENIVITEWAISAVHALKTKKKTTSKYKGVFYCKRDGWVAYLSKRDSNGKRKWLLYQRCKTEKEAAIVRNKFVLDVFGELAYQNKIEEDDKE